MVTEAEWLACTDRSRMLGFLKGKAGDRKLRLFAVACCRRVWHLLQEDCYQWAVEVAEAHADGLVKDGELIVAKDRVWSARYSGPVNYLEGDIGAATYAALATTWVGDAGNAWQAADYASRCADDAVSGVQDGTETTENKAQAGLLRCIFGNPFRPLPAVEPAWLAWNAETIPRLAQAIYEDRAFDRLPILADALEEAGCTEPDLLAHCRRRGKHARGCWVVDLLLGKG